MSTDQTITSTVPPGFDMTRDSLRRLAAGYDQRKHISRALYKYTKMWMKDMLTFVRNKMYSMALMGETGPFRVRCPWDMFDKYADGPITISVIVRQYHKAGFNDIDLFYELGFTDDSMPFQMVAETLEERNGIIMKDVSDSSKGAEFWVELYLK